MKKLFTVPLSVLLLIISLSTNSLSAPHPKEPDTATKLKAIESFGKLPLSFTENRGQLNSNVSYYLKGKKGTIEPGALSINERGRAEKKNNPLRETMDR